MEVGLPWWSPMKSNQVKWSNETHGRNNAVSPPSVGRVDGDPHACTSELHGSVIIEYQIHLPPTSEPPRLYFRPAISQRRLPFLPLPGHTDSRLSFCLHSHAGYCRHCCHWREGLRAVKVAKTSNNMSGPSLPISHFLDSSRPPSHPALLAAHPYSRSPLPPIQDTIQDTIQETSTDTGTLGAPHHALQAHAHATAPISHPPIEHSPLRSASTPSPATPASKGHTGASLYACGDCGRRYSRPEHLQRHVQTHTLGRRFACSICGKSFARADLKKRHESNHDNDSSKKRRRTDTSPGAGRVTHACKACATARVKCQEDKPCQRCVRRGLTCVSSEAGSTAAMHLMNLSASAHATSQSSPDDTETPSPSASYNQQALPNITSLTGQQGADQSLLFPRTPPIKPEEGQLPTPDTVVEQG